MFRPASRLATSAGWEAAALAGAAATGAAGAGAGAMGAATGAEASSRVRANHNHSVPVSHAGGVLLSSASWLG